MAMLNNQRVNIPYMEQMGHLNTTLFFVKDSAFPNFASFRFTVPSQRPSTSHNGPRYHPLEWDLDQFPLKTEVLLQNAPRQKWDTISISCIYNHVWCYIVLIKVTSYNITLYQIISQYMLYCIIHIFVQYTYTYIYIHTCIVYWLFTIMRYPVEYHTGLARWINIDLIHTTVVLYKLWPVCFQTGSDLAL